MQEIVTIVLDNIKQGFGIPLCLLLLLAMMILPIHPLLLDLFFTFSITLSLLVLLAGVYCLRPLDFAVFPTVLLLSTLMRLALNVASTRVVLLYGHNGGSAAGKVIEAFGQVVIGGNFAVGIVVFLILVIINFVVVTKGAGRISEVSARFTLDSLPGKQMAIDADLNAGLINQEEAVERRAELSQEADFYGSMDGASKFVRGDAVAGILILLINMIGGTLIGVLQHNMSFLQACEVYVLLTIGDGLVAQIPSLILSTAAAMLVTRVSRSQMMSTQISQQLFKNPKPLTISAGVLMVLGCIPGMPHFAFLGLAGGLFAASYWMFKPKLQSKPQLEDEISAQNNTKKETEDQEITWDDVPPVDVIGLEIGYRLIPLVNKEETGELMARIKGVRKKLSQELGFLIPAVHIRDNLDLMSNGYRVSVLGVVVAESSIEPQQDLAINPGHVQGELQGIKTKDPSFGLSAYWIAKEYRQHAQTLGYTVVDASTVVATHLSQSIYNHAHQLIGHEEVQQMLNLLAKDAPKLVEDLVPKTLSLGVVVKVIQNLLYENVSVRDIRTIAETLVEQGHKTQDPLALVEAVRINLGPMIVQQINGLSKEISIITLDPELEQILQRSLQANDNSTMMIEPGLASKLQLSLQKFSKQQEDAGLPAILVVPGNIRMLLAKFTRNLTNQISVLSYQEIPEDKNIRIIANIGNQGEN